MIREDEAAPGVVSSMRRTTKLARRLGAFMIFSGIVLSGAILVLDRGYELITIIVTLVSLGPTLIVGVTTAKAWQAHAEERRS